MTVKSTAWSHRVTRGSNEGAALEGGAGVTHTDANLSWGGVGGEEDGIMSVITDYGQLAASSRSLPSPRLGLPAITGSVCITVLLQA